MGQGTKRWRRAWGPRRRTRKHALVWSSKLRFSLTVAEILARITAERERERQRRAGGGRVRNIAVVPRQRPAAAVPRELPWAAVAADVTTPLPRCGA